MTNLAIDLVLFCCVLAFATGIVLSKAKRSLMTLTHFAEAVLANTCEGGATSSRTNRQCSIQADNPEGRTDV